jgi:Clostripain family
MAERKEWTLIFFNASDNPLAPGIVSQLKALKNAGYHPQVNVIAQFDPHSKGVPVHVFDVNLVDKLKARGGWKVGTGKDPYVRNLVFDKLWSEADKDVRDSIASFLSKPKDGPREELEATEAPLNVESENGIVHETDWGNFLDESEVDVDPSPIKYDPPMPLPKMSGEQGPRESLMSLLRFCQAHYPAEHFMLFILGHGVAVGNDMFLLDEDAPAQSLTLKDLGTVLGDFTRTLPTGSKFEMLGFHSCSMSSLEVAYELQGTAKYMLASQGPAFVGSWPYTQIVMRILNDIVRKAEGGEARSVESTVKKIFSYCRFNSYDFQLAGYSFDLCLADLQKIDTLTADLNSLSNSLIAGLRLAEIEKPATDPLAKELILLAHWEAQSFWHDTYTDLDDFCRCLRKRCEAAKSASPETTAILGALIADCKNVQGKLIRGRGGDDDRFIMRQAFAGPAYQYSRGVSVYFPWSAPLNTRFWPDEYSDYCFEATGWRQFLTKYFDVTRRSSHEFEERAENGGVLQTPLIAGSEEDLLERITSIVVHEGGQLGKGAGSDETGPPTKGAGSDPTGVGCDCPSIKNYPSFTRERLKKGPREVKAPLSPGFFDGIQIR